MKPQPERRPRRTMRRRVASLALIVALVAAGADAQVPDTLSDDWYHVELLVFAREDAASLRAERWEPLPVLSYPDRYRYLVDPDRADRRVAESLAFASRIDERGIQRLTVPSPVSLLDDAGRPDAAINEPYVAEDPNQPRLSGAGPDGEPLPSPDGMPGDADARRSDSPATAGESASAADAGDTVGETESTDEEKAPRVLLALPERLLPDAGLAFRKQARTLRRRGEQVLFHGHWWSRLPEGGDTLPLVIDRAADADVSAWPALQGSVHLYRTRYLHLDVDLWLNTMASYLPPGWQINPPPLAAPSLVSATLAGEALDPWAPPAPVPDEAGSDAGRSVSAGGNGGDGMAGEASEALQGAREPSRDEAERESYPWRHAITHRQSRRMRSGEIHYLDHPVIGVIVRIRPVSEDLLPYAPEEDLEFRQRHRLPEEYFVLPEMD